MDKGHSYSVLFTNKLVSYFKVTTFICYANILRLGASPCFQRLKVIGGRCLRYLERIASKFGYPISKPGVMNQTTVLSSAMDSQQNAIQFGGSGELRQKPEDKESPLMSGLPVVFVHFSNSGYLKYSLFQAKHSNPESTIYLIGDDTNDCYDFVEHHSFSDYFQRAKDFSKIYQHFNTTAYTYETFCFQRWFILLEFLVANGLEKCLYLDSDTMLYADVTEEQKKFSQFDFTLSHKTSGCTFFLNRVEALSDFCQFIMDIYTKKERYYFDRMIAQYATFKKNGMAGGACDMTVFDLYSYDHFGEIGEVAQIIDGSVYDPSINVPHPGFETENGIKKIIWKGASPYGIQLRTAREIKFNSLQFQGDSKRLMRRYCTGTNSEIGL